MNVTCEIAVQWLWLLGGGLVLGLIIAGLVDAL
jgi:hypothetical protein